MPERLYQLRFDENLKLSVPQNVTPEGFAGLEFDKGERLSRFVREVAERVSIQSPNDVAQYLLTKVYVPFEDFDQEEMWVLLLDTKCRITHEIMVYRRQVNRRVKLEAYRLGRAIQFSWKRCSTFLSRSHGCGGGRIGV